MSPFVDFGARNGVGGRTNCIKCTHSGVKEVSRGWARAWTWPEMPSSEADMHFLPEGVLGKVANPHRRTVRLRPGLGEA
jgi:hypothetical protein